MKIMVTGGCGFIGSNFIINAINEHNCNILNFDKLTYAGNKDNLSTISSSANYNLVNDDICNINSISSSINSFRPDAIVHFAAESHVDRSIDDPFSFIKTNINGTANILEAALLYYNKSDNKNFRFLHVSTDEVYGSLGTEGFFNESTPYDPSSPYSASKASSDHLVRAWHRTFNLPVLITNCSNNYGPLQFPEKLIPLMIANCLDEKPLPIYGKGDNIRDWLYVEDHCKALFTVLNNGKSGETYNIGGNNEIRNIDIVKSICKTLDSVRPRMNNMKYEELISYVEDRPGHDYRYAIDSSKIHKNLKWEPIESFESGIKKTINWYLSNEEWWRKIKYKQERLGLV